MRTLKRAGAVIGILLVLFVGLLVTGLPAAWIDRYLNQVYDAADAPEVTAATRALHETLFIADLHADTMLWDRDFLAEADFGHVDLPRLVEGNVALQVFVVVTQTPSMAEQPEGARLLNPEASECISHENLNLTGWLQVAQLRPFEVWFDLEARAFYQIRRLQEFIAESQRRHEADPTTPYLLLIRTAEDLQTVVDGRRNGDPVVGAMLAVEGPHWIGGDGIDVEAGLEALFEAGVRMVAPTHRFNNALGASSEGCDQLAGLTEDGRTFLDAAEARGFVLDLAHASDTGIAEATEGRGGPIVVSHTGVRRHCGEAHAADDCVFERNIPDALIQEVARTGGAVAIGYWPEAVGRGMERVAAAFHGAHAVLSDPDFVAEMRTADPDYDPLEHIALGSDFDGSVHTPFDVGGLALLTAALTDMPGPDGAPAFDADALRLIYGANVCRIFALRLPEGGPEAADRICSPLRPGGQDG